MYLFPELSSHWGSAEHEVWPDVHSASELSGQRWMSAGSAALSADSSASATPGAHMQTEHYYWPRRAGLHTEPELTVIRSHLSLYFSLTSGAAEMRELNVWMSAENTHFGLLLTSNKTLWLIERISAFASPFLLQSFTTDPLLDQLAAILSMTFLRPHKCFQLCFGYFTLITYWVAAMGRL